MIVERTIVINRIEPAPCSLRLPSGMDAKLDVTFLTQNGTPYGSDVAAQLSLTTRSDDVTSVISFAATDMANGKARALIPAQSDPNGARLRIAGTVAGEPMLLAIGTLLPIAFAGLVDPPVDVIDTIDLTMNRNEDLLMDVKLWASDDVPYDLTANATTIAAAVYATAGGARLVPMSVTVLGSNEVRLSLTKNQVNALPNDCWWSLTAGFAGGTTTLAQGDVTVSGVQAPPFTPVTLPYNYTKQAILVAPASGQIIHCDNALDILRISSIDGNSNSATGTLNQLIVGDTIQCGATVWSVVAIQFVTNYYEVTISPASQAAVSGTQSITFARPS